MAKQPSKSSDKGKEEEEGKFQANPTPLQSQSSTGSIASEQDVSAMSIEWIAKTPSCDRHPVEYSEQTKRQIEQIKELVAEQEKETAAKEAAGEKVDSQVSTTFAQDVEYIREQIAKANKEHEMKMKQEREERKKKKKKKEEAKSDNSAK